MKNVVLLCLFFYCVAGYGQQISSPVPEILFGEWDVWIPGAVTYKLQETKVVQNYSPGAAMNRLLIAKNGSYRWGESKGLLKPVKPWYAEAGKNYFRINDLKGNNYDFWYKPETDQLILLFGEVGGHAASGYRWPARKNSPSSEPIDRHSSVKAEPAGERSDDVSLSKKPEFIANARVEILWSGSWFKGQILAVKNNSYLVRYDGWGSLYDEWVTEERIRLLK